MITVNHHRLINILLCLFLVILPFAVVSAKTIRLGNTHAYLTSLVIVANDQGFFEQEGVDVELVQLKTGADGLKGIQSGQLHLYSTPDVTFVKHYHSNDQLRVLAILGERGNETKLVVGGDSGIISVTDLKGRNVAVHRGLAFHWFLDLLLQRHGLTENDIKIQFMHSSVQPDAMHNGTVDAFVGREPFISQAATLAGDNIRVIESPNLMMKRFLLVSEDTFLRTNDEQVKSILRALVKAEKLVNEEHERLGEILTRVFNKKHEEIHQQVIQMKLRLKLDNYLLYTLEKVANWWQLVDGNKKPREIDFLDVIVSEPLAAVKPHGMLIYR